MDESERQKVLAVQLHVQKKAFQACPDQSCCMVYVHETRKLLYGIRAPDKKAFHTYPDQQDYMGRFESTFPERLVRRATQRPPPFELTHLWFLTPSDTLVFGVNGFASNRGFQFCELFVRPNPRIVLGLLIYVPCLRIRFKYIFRFRICVLNTVPHILSSKFKSLNLNGL